MPINPDILAHPFTLILLSALAAVIFLMIRVTLSNDRILTRVTTILDRVTATQDRHEVQLSELSERLSELCGEHEAFSEHRIKKKPTRPQH